MQGLYKYIKCKYIIKKNKIYFKNILKICCLYIAYV